MKIRRYAAFGAAVAATALALSACQSPGSGGDGEDGGDGGNEGIESGTAITFGWNQPFYEYNNNSTTGNALANTLVLYLMNAGFNYYDSDLNLVQDESFGTYQKTSDDPLTVEYTINDDVAWSDGTPVDAADMLLTWAWSSGQLNTITEEDLVVDPETGEVQNQDVVDQNVYFNSQTPGMALVSEVPEVSEDGQTVTLTWDEPFADWETAFGVGVPAHVVAMHALDIDDPQEAKDALVEAIESNDTEALAPISKFWNEGFAFSGTLPDDDSLYLSSGAYLLTEFVENQYVTLEANPDYTGDLAPSVERVTIRYNEDPMAQLQALENGEVDAISPQATADLLQAAQALGDDFGVITGFGGTYEHVDLVFNNGGPFDPATYGGDEATALAVRDAFLSLLPRQEILDTLILPLNPEAEVRQSFTTVPGAPGYDEIVAGNGSDTLPTTVDQSVIDAATQTLADAGVTTPIDVRMLYGEGNVRRENQYELIRQSVSQNGLFNLIDGGNADWGTLLADSSTYDASLFGWISTSTAVTEADANYRTGGANNYGGYSNAEVDALFDELQTETDEARQTEIKMEIESHLWADRFGATIFQFPEVTVYNAAVQGIDPVSIAPGMFWNYWDWSVEGDTAGEPTSEEPTEEATE